MLARSERASFPNLLVIGAPKCGTTSLHRYLDLHPEITMSAQKELRYFSRADWQSRLDWYFRQFEGMATPIRGETTPRYARYPQIAGVPKRIHSLLPAAQLIYLVRDPVARMLSQERQWWSDGDRTTLSAHLRHWDSLENPLLAPSRYATQLEQYLLYFPAEQILVIDQDDLKANRRRALREVFGFLKVDPNYASAEFDGEDNRRDEKLALTRIGAPIWNHVLGPTTRRLPTAVRDRTRGPLVRALSRPMGPSPGIDPYVLPDLQVLLGQEADRLRELTGKRFESWSV